MGLMGVVRAARRAAVFVVAFICIAAALLIVWHALTPSVLARLSTGQLLVPLALLVLPVLALTGWALDRRAVRKARGL